MKSINKTVAANNGWFTVNIPLVKSQNQFIIEKAKPTGDGKDYFLFGEASNTLVDKTKERVSPEFIKSMRSQANGMTVFAEHKRIITKTLGYISAVGGDENSFTAETALEDPNDNKLVNRIIKKLKHGTHLAYSIGGFIDKVTKTVDDTGASIRNLMSGELLEITVTAMPAGNVDWLSAVKKSLSSYQIPNEGGIMQANNSADPVLFKSLMDKVYELVFQKTLAEMVQTQGLQSQLNEYWWAFRDAIWRIIYDTNSNFTPQQRKDAINNIAGEFSVKVESISSALASLANQIETSLIGKNAE